jgi:hypothetical protein
MTNNTSYCREMAPASNGKMKGCYELQGIHLQAMEGGDDASGSTPHAYIGKSWRLGRGMGACITTGCKNLINVVGAILGNMCIHAWMVV